MEAFFNKEMPDREVVIQAGICGANRSFHLFVS